MNIYHSNYVLNADQPESFYTPYINDKLYFTFVPYQMTQLCDIYFQDIKVINDESLLPTSQNNNYQFLTQENNDVRETTQLSRKDGVFVVLTLRLSPYVSVINRSYKKVSQLMSELGGFVQIVLACIGIVMKRYNNFKFTVDLANNLYLFDLEDQQNKKKNTLNAKQISTNQVNNSLNTPQNSSRPMIQGNQVNQKSNEQIQLNNNQNQGINQTIIFSSNNIQSDSRIFKIDDKQFSQKQQQQQMDITESYNTSKQKMKAVVKKIKNKDELFKAYIENEKFEQCKIVQDKLEGQSFMIKQFKSIISQQKKLSVGFKYFVSKFSWNKFFNSEYNQYITKATKMIHRDLDICNILDKIQQIEKIKNIIFDSDQRNVFSFYPKPIVKIDNLQGQIITSQNNNQVNQLVKENQKQSNLMPEKCQLSDQQIKGILTEKSDFQTVGQYKTLFNSYLSLKNFDEGQITNTSINQRLMQYLGSDLLKVFYLAELLENSNNKIDQSQFISHQLDQYDKNKQHQTQNIPVLSKFQKAINTQYNNEKIRTTAANTKHQNVPQLGQSDSQQKSINISFKNQIQVNFIKNSSKNNENLEQMQQIEKQESIFNNLNNNNNGNTLENRLESSVYEIPQENEQSGRIQQNLQNYINQ